MPVMGQSAPLRDAADRTPMLSGGTVRGKASRVPPVKGAASGGGFHRLVKPVD